MRKAHHVLRLESMDWLNTRYFLQDLEDEIHLLLCNNRNGDDGEYLGFDFDRDSIEEVESAIQSVPNVLSRKEDSSGLYPIQMQVSLFPTEGYRVSASAVPFVSLLARLGITFGQFEVEERGGLLIEDGFGHNVLQRLVMSSKGMDGDRSHHDLADRRCVVVLKELKDTGSFTREDVRNFALLSVLCSQSVFAIRRFKFLIELNPDELGRADRNGCLPLHYTAVHSSILGFRLVLDAGLRCFPERKGINLLFRKNRNDATPFMLACARHGRERVMEIIDIILVKRSDKYNTAEALVLAVIDERIDLDCVYFLLRREPDMLQKLLSG